MRRFRVFACAWAGVDGVKVAVMFVLVACGGGGRRRRQGGSHERSYNFWLKQVLLNQVWLKHLLFEHPLHVTAKACEHPAENKKMVATTTTTAKAKKVDPANLTASQEEMPPPGLAASAAKAATAGAEASAEVPWWQDEAVRVRYQQGNPKQQGTAAATRYEAYKAATTVGEALALGADTKDLKHDKEKGHILIMQVGVEDDK